MTRCGLALASRWSRSRRRAGPVALVPPAPGCCRKRRVAAAVDATTQTINLGEYLARAGDCVACHTRPNGKPFAGGRAMATPFGSLYVPNITPDDETGIGKWTADDFYRMMHTGVSRDGTLLYPAMPFASLHKVTRADSDAIYAYLMSVPPVKQENRPHELRFPFNKRELARSAGARSTSRRASTSPTRSRSAAVEPRRLPRRGPGPLRHVPHRDQCAGRLERSPRRSRAG